MQQDVHQISKDIEPSSAFWRWFFFLSGIIATIAYRITFLFDPFWVKIIWYVGTVGFIFYFGHRAQVESKRARLVRERHLVETLDTSAIDPDQKAALMYLVKTNLTSKVRFNSAFIFWASIVALVAAAALDMMHYVLR